MYKKHLYQNVHIAILTISTIIISCNSGNSSHSDAYIVSDIRKEMKNLKVLPLADEIESVSYIPLQETENDESIIGAVLAYAITKEYIYVHPIEGERVVLYNIKGEFIKTVIKFGQGPGEFNGTLMGMQADEENNRLYVYSPERIFVYSLDGTFIESFFPDYNSVFTRYIGNDRFAAIAFPYVTFQGGSFGIGIFTKNGDTIATKNNFSSPLVPAEKTGFTLGLTPPAYSSQSESVLFKTGSNDTIFRISKNSIDPACIIQLRNSNDEIIRSLDATDFLSLTSGQFEGDGDIYISDMFETVNQFYLRFRYNKDFYVASVHKKTGNTLVEKCIKTGNLDELGSANIQFGMSGTMSYNNFPIWGNMEGNNLVQIITHYELSLYRNNSSVIIPEALSELEEEGNPVFILYKIKE